MASKNSAGVRKVQKPATGDSQNSASELNSSSGNDSSGARRKTTCGRVVKSRYMQIEKKPTVAKSKTQNESCLVPPQPASPKTGGARKPRVGSPARRTISRLSVQPDATSASMPSILETSSAGGNIFQSTALDDHCLLPELDLSVIKGNAAPPGEVDPKAHKWNQELVTFLLAFLTAKIEHKTQELKEEAERNLLIMMEEEERWRSNHQSLKRQHLLREKQKQLNSLLNMQAAALTPAAEAAKPFAEEYKVFAAAVDTTRHELPLKNLHTEEDRGRFLDKAVVCLNQSQRALELYMKDVPRGSESTIECLKEMKSSACEINQQLHSASSDLLELSSLATRETVLVQQSLEEDKIGRATVQTLFSDGSLGFFGFI